MDLQDPTEVLSDPTPMKPRIVMVPMSLEHISSYTEPMSSARDHSAQAQSIVPTNILFTPNRPAPIVVPMSHTKSSRVITPHHKASTPTISSSATASTAGRDDRDEGLRPVVSVRMSLVPPSPKRPLYTPQQARQLQPITTEATADIADTATLIPTDTATTPAATSKAPTPVAMASSPLPVYAINDEHSITPIPQPDMFDEDRPILVKTPSSPGPISRFDEDQPIVPESPSRIDEDQPILSKSSPIKPIAVKSLSPSKASSRFSEDEPIVVKASPSRFDEDQPIKLKSSSHPTEFEEELPIKPVAVQAAPKSPSRFAEDQAILPKSPSRFDEDQAILPKSPSRFAEDQEILPKSPSRFAEDQAILPKSPSRFDEDQPIVPKSPSRFDEDQPIVPRSPSRFDKDQPILSKSSPIKPIAVKSQSPSKASSRFSEDEPIVPKSPSRFDEDQPIVPKSLSRFDEDQPIVPKSPSRFDEDHAILPKSSPIKPIAVQSVPKSPSRFDEDQPILPKSSSYPTAFNEDVPITVSTSTSAITSTSTGFDASSRFDDDVPLAVEKPTTQKGSLMNEEHPPIDPSAAQTEADAVPSTETKALTASQDTGVNVEIDTKGKQLNTLLSSTHTGGWGFDDQSVGGGGGGTFDEQPLGVASTGEGRFDDLPVGVGGSSLLNPNPNPNPNPKPSSTFMDEFPPIQPLGTARKSSMLAEFPSGEGMDNSAQGPPSVDIEADKRPLLVRIVDKNWKTRNTAYDELRREIVAVVYGLDTDKHKQEQLWENFSPLLTKMTADTNANALDSGMETATAFIEAAPPSVCAPYIDKIYANAVDKGFNANKSSTQTKGKALLLKSMEVDEGGAQGCCRFLLGKLQDKKPKVPAMCLDVVKEGIRLFGVRCFPVKEVVKALGDVFQSGGSPAREAAMGIILELHRWIGKPPLSSLLDSLRPAQRADFDRLVGEQEEGSPIPTLYLRSERPKKGEAHTGGTGGNGAYTTGADGSRKVGAQTGGGPLNGGANGGGEAGRQWVDEVDLAKVLKATEYAKLVAEVKWSEQLRGLQMVIDAIGAVPKIKAGTDVHDIVGVCKGFLRQGHVQLQVSSLKILLLLADGLRQDFNLAIRPLTQAIVAKMKEKRLVGDVQATLLMVLRHCLSFDSLLDDVLEGIRSKKEPAHLKLGLLDLISTTVKEMPERISPDSFKPLVEAIIQICEDSDAKVREACSTTLSVVAHYIAQSPSVTGTTSKGGKQVTTSRLSEASKALAALEQTHPRVFKKIHSEVDMGTSVSSSSSSSSSNSTSSSVSSSTSNRAKSVSKSSSTREQPTSSSTSTSTSNSSIMASPLGTVGKAKKPTSSSAGTTKSMSGSTNTASSSSSSSGAHTGGKDNDDVAEELTVTSEDAQEFLLALQVPGWEGAIQQNMNSAKWQDKVDAVQAIERRLSEVEEGGRYSAALVKYLSDKTGGLKISNANVLKAVISCCSTAAARCGSSKFSKPAAWELLKHFGDKMSDKKNKELVWGLLTALSEAVTCAFVVKRMTAVMDKAKAPLAHEHYLQWMKVALVEFGFSSFPIKDVSAFCQEELDNKVAGVRTAAVEVMGALYHQVGPRLQSVAITNDMSPKVKDLLEAEFAKVGHDPTAASKATRNGSGSNGGDNRVGVGAKGGSKGNGQVQSSLDGCIPRQDLMNVLDKNVMTELNLVEGKNSWQNRKAAIESVITCCDRTGHYIEYNKATAELLKALRARGLDTQANLKPLAVNAIGHIVSSLDPEISGCKALKLVGAGLMTGLADNKKPMRDASVSALQCAVTLNNTTSTDSGCNPLLLNTLLPFVTEGLSNVVGRFEMLTWLLQHVEVIKVGDDLVPLLGAMVLAMQDKTATVRALAEQVVTALMAKGYVSKIALEKATRDLPPAVKRAIQPAVDRMMMIQGTLMQGKKGDVSASSDPDPLQRVGHSSSTDATHCTSQSQFLSLPLPPPTVTHSHSQSEGPPSNKDPTRLVRGVSSQSSDRGNKSPSHRSKSAGRVAPLAMGDEPEWYLKKTATGKFRRLEEFYKLNWPQPPSAEPGLHEFTLLKATWDPLLEPGISSLIFPHIGATERSGATLVNQDTFIPGMERMSAQLQCPYIVQHTDLILRWCGCVLGQKESSSGLLRLLQLIHDLFSVIHSVHSAILHDSEIMSILPHLIEKSGHKSERAKTAFKEVLAIACEIVVPNKMNQHLIQALGSLNKKSRLVCIEEIHRVVEVAGVASLGRSGVKDIGSFLEAKDNDITARNACLDLVYLIYCSLSSDLPKLVKLMGNLSDRSVAMIKDRIDQRSKYNLRQSVVLQQTQAQHSQPATHHEVAHEVHTAKARAEGRKSSRGGVPGHKECVYA
jgi:hypothetical protein